MTSSFQNAVLRNVRIGLGALFFWLIGSFGLALPWLEWRGFIHGVGPTTVSAWISLGVVSMSLVVYLVVEKDIYFGLFCYWENTTTLRRILGFAILPAVLAGLAISGWATITLVFDYNSTRYTRWGILSGVSLLLWYLAALGVDTRLNGNDPFEREE